MPPPPDVLDGEEHYTVQAFLDSRLTGKGRGQHLEYLVRWEGYPPNFDEWITAANLQEDLDPATYKKLRDTLAEKKKAK
jgi:Chromo (CHRromatin Organisation MOdifier) domain